MNYILPITFVPGIAIDETQLIIFFELEKDAKRLCKKSGVNNTTLPHNLRGKSLMFIINNGKIEHFASSSYNLLTLEQLFRTVPDELQPLKAQLNTLLTAINISLSRSKIAEEKESIETLEYLQKLVDCGSVETFRRGDEIQLRAEATEEEAEISDVVVEHSFLVKNIQSDATAYIATPGIASCTALVIYNPYSKKVGLAHLDLFTVNTYEESLNDMFDQCHGDASHQNEIYLIGSDIFSYKLSTQLSGIASCYNVSRSLTLSIFDFIKKRQDSKLQGYFYSDSICRSGTVFVAASEHQCQIFSSSRTLGNILERNFRKNVSADLIDYPIHYTQLVDIKDSYDSSLSCSINQTHMKKAIQQGRRDYIDGRDYDDSSEHKSPNM